MLSNRTVPVRLSASTVSIRRKKSFKNFLMAMAFVSPFAVGFLIFNLYPILMSLYYSFTNFNILQKPVWVGLDNYTKMFSDPLVRRSLINTGYLIFVGIPLVTVCSLLIAVLLNAKTPASGFFRTVIYMPSVVPPVASALLFAWLLNPNYGLVNGILDLFHISGPGWLGSPEWSKPAILIMLLWGMGNTIVLYLAALQEVPEDLSEAAQIDGAGKLSILLNVTLPSIRPVIFFNVITGIITFTQFFAQVYVVNTSVNGVSSLGAPNHSTLFYALYLYQNGFAFLKMGYASAMAWLLLVFTLLATWIMLRSSGDMTDLNDGR